MWEHPPSSLRDLAYRLKSTRFEPILRGSGLRCVPDGASRMACTGCWTSRFARMPVGFAENFAVLHHLALALLRREPTARVGVKAKRLMCEWEETYLATVLTP